MVKARTSIKLLALLISLTISIALCELTLRLFCHKRLALPADERILLYKHDSQLGWFPSPNSKSAFRGHRLISVQHNSRGFRDDEHVIADKQRILVLGDSFVWGYDVEKGERFTDLLAKKRPNSAVYNLGVSGYGTDQEYLLLKQQFDFYKPHLVFLLFCNSNDFLDNSHNRRYGCYKPYLVPSGNELTTKGVPVPGHATYYLTANPKLAQSYFVRAIIRGIYKVQGQNNIKIEDPTYSIFKHMSQFIQDHKAEFVVGLVEKDAELSNALNQWKIPNLHFESAHLMRYSSHGLHWTPAGHKIVSEELDEFINRKKILGP